jgi:hypothetical protein
LDCVQDLGDNDHAEGRPKREQQRTGADRGYSQCSEQTLGGHAIHQRADGNLHSEAGKRADCQD